MKLNHKGYSLIEILAVFAILGILTTLAVAGYSRYIQYSRQKSYLILVSSAMTAMENYKLDHPTVNEVTLEELENGGYISKPVDPSSSGKTCRGKVFVSNNANPTQTSSENALEKNDYKVSLCCLNHNYTYEPNGKDRAKDKYCKVDPYNISDIRNIKVLNVYSNGSYANYVKNWMDEYGMGIIKVTPVSLEDFNANPSLYLGTNGNWKYDEVVFGFADCYSSKDLSVASAELMRQYLTMGGAAVFGHDTITKGCGNHVNFIKLQDFVGIEATTNLTWEGRTGLKIQKQGVFTQYPYNIGNVGSSLTIETSHVYGQVAHGDVWITFDNIGTPEKSIYLSTYGNNAFIQTGHTNGSATVQEKKIIANIIFYMVAKQYVE